MEKIWFHFHGGAREVGNVGCTIEKEGCEALLIDYGLAASKPPRYPSPTPPVKNAVITHAHIDHIGMAPWLVGQHGTKLHSTPLVSALSEIMWRDTYKVSSIEGYPLTWDKRDIEDSLESWIPHDHGDPFDLDGWICTLHGAGHVPGASMIELEAPGVKILWTGDIDTRMSPNVIGAKPSKCDILVMEATYAGRDHLDRVAEEERLVERIQEVRGRGGVALIPSFASGRGQDIIKILHDKDPSLNVHYDGMGTRISKIWNDHPAYLRDPTGFERAIRWTKRVRGKSDRFKALEADVIVTTSGMLDGGPAIWYLNRLRHDSANAILLTGYQAPGSGGRSLLDTGALPIYKRMTKVELEVDQFDLSNHAGRSELLDFAMACEPRHLILFHTPDEDVDEFSALFGKNPPFDISVPINGRDLVVELDTQEANR